MFEEIHSRNPDKKNNDFDKSHETLKELTDAKNVDMKTELDDNEIKRISKIMFLQNHFNNSSLRNLTSSFMRLRLSKGRSSRKEIIDAFKVGQQIDEKNIRLAMVNTDNLNPNQRLK